MTNKSDKPNLLQELTQKKLAAQKAGNKGSQTFQKFKYKKERNENNSNVGPSWGGRKGN